MLDAIDRGEPRISGPHAGWWSSRMRAAERRASRRSRSRPTTGPRPCDCSGSTPRPSTGIPRRRRRPLPARPRPENGGRTGYAGSSTTPAAGTRRPARPAASLHRGEVLERSSSRDRRAAPVLMFVGRFLAFKRVPLLIRAYARARERMSVPAPLVIWGGVPGSGRASIPHRGYPERHRRRVLRGWRDTTSCRSG